MDDSIIVAGLAVSVVSAFITVTIYSRKKRSVWGGLALGFCLGIIGVIIALIVPFHSEGGTYAERNWKKAKIIEREDKYLVVLNIVALVVVLVVNGLANALPLNGLTTGEISDRFQVYFVPAGYVFSIWGLIYIGLIAFAVYQALPKQRDNPRLQRISYGFAVSCLANAAWIFLWHYQRFPLTLVAMLALLLALIFVYLRLDIGRAEVSTLEKVCVDIPFSIYLGWVTVATIANVTSLLDYVGWGGWGIGPQVWTVIMLIAATGITAAVGFTRGDIAYMLVIVWAFIGIAVKHVGTPTVAVATRVMTAIVVVVIALNVVRRLRRPQAPATNV